MAINEKKAGSAMALPAFSFPFRNGERNEAQRAAALPPPFGLPFRDVYKRQEHGGAGAGKNTRANSAGGG